MPYYDKFRPMRQASCQIEVKRPYHAQRKKNPVLRQMTPFVALGLKPKQNAPIYAD